MVLINVGTKEERSVKRIFFLISAGAGAGPAPHHCCKTLLLQYLPGCGGLRCTFAAAECPLVTPGENKDFEILKRDSVWAIDKDRVSDSHGSALRKATWIQILMDMAGLTLDQGRKKRRNKPTHELKTALKKGGLSF